MDTDIPKQITPLVRRITAGNPGMFTGPGTNTYLIGDEEVTVIDPGPALHEHIEAIIQASANIKQILLTHTHPDHSPGTRLLQDNIGVPVFALITESSKDQDITFTPERILIDGEIIANEYYSIEVIHTPGHASNHLCYLLKDEKLLFTGDHIMDGSTVVIASPDGSMQDYIDSLAKLKEYDLNKIAPGHGELIEEPYAVVDWIIKHRFERESKVIDVLKQHNSGDLNTLVKDIYSDVDAMLHPVAKWSLESHLIKLIDEGVVTRKNDKFFYIGDRSV
ncbi:MAG TPA: MBL fold metallo-hydrolase [Gammaproteobacteria bacterium]|jgi:glyoxylase-like metal-dependent hydrolase (beta-lactamase superfamily II)|nr:MBL fold metallo-hydrolase [Gammaproteobacteria bacterium]HIK97439.1 MBL fold metallo-hydrolase [Gammaproteobacteria bacterium]|tara:strand:+ start:1672 stop:2505 length:834 start_codon:yes stop_codon:yes gene_type:complete